MQQSDEGPCSTLDFLRNGGVMGARIRSFDWSSNPLGSPASWPSGLQTGVRLVLSSRHQMSILWGPELIQIYNDAYVDSIGAERDASALGQSARICWAKIWDVIGPQIDYVMHGDGATWNENQLLPITRDGRLDEGYWTYSYNPLNDNSAPHGVGGVLVLCVETTAMVLAERRSVAERERLQLMFAQAPGFMAMLRGPEHRVEFVNAAYQQLIGHRDVIGKTMAEAQPSAAALGYVDLLDGVYESGIAYTAMAALYVLEPSPGFPAQERYIDFVYQPIKDIDGWVTGVFVEGADVTHRREAELALQALNASLEVRVSTALAETRLLNKVVEATDICVQVLAQDRRILAINHIAFDALTHLYGVHAHVGQDLLALLDAAGVASDKLQGYWLRALRGAQFTVTEEFGDPAHATAWHEMHFNVLRDAAGKGIGAYAVGRDVTQARRASERLAAADAQLLQAQKIETLGQLTGGVAHDFNNILMVISAGIDLVAADVAPQRKRLLDGMRQAVGRGAGLTRQLLTFSHRQPLNPRPVDIVEQIDGMHELLERSLRGNIRIRYEMEAGLWPVEVDPGEMELTLLNLAVNARDALPTGGTITIGAGNMLAAGQIDLPGDHVWLSVTDTGTGMSPDVLARATEPYFTTKGVGKGSGLGLAQTFGFAQAAGGSIAIRSAPGEGTTVTIFLPRSLLPANAKQINAGIPLEAVSGSLGVALVVEDDTAVAALTVEMIRHLGYAVVCVDSAQAALDKLHELQAADGVDVVLSDVMMPGEMDGTDLAREISCRHPQMPVVLVSGVIDAARVKLGSELAREVILLAKPFRLQGLDIALREAILRKHSVPQSATLGVASVSHG